MLDLNPDTVCFIINKSHEFQAKEEVVISEDHPDSPSDDWALQVLADHRDDYTYLELKETIDDLDKDQQIALVALMWLGRGDYTLDEWEIALEEAEDRWSMHTADYLIATPLVSEYLAEGLDQHGYSCEE